MPWACHKHVSTRTISIKYRVVLVVELVCACSLSHRIRHFLHFSLRIAMKSLRNTTSICHHLNRVLALMATENYDDGNNRSCPQCATCLCLAWAT